MKRDYLIWLKGGDCITGTSDEQEIDDFIQEWRCRPANGIFSLTDTDGTLYIKSDEIEAVDKLAKQKKRWD